MEKEEKVMSRRGGVTQNPRFRVEQTVVDGNKVSSPRPNRAGYVPGVLSGRSKVKKATARSYRRFTSTPN
jgi:hypothetical protein